YMLPAVPFFWVTRVPQHKYRGYFIHPEKGMLRYGEEGAALRVTSPFIDPHFNHMTPVYFEKTGERALNPFGPHGFDPHAVSYNIVDAALTPMGRLNDQIREWFKPAGAWLQRHADTVRKYTGIEMDVTPLGRKKLPDGIGITNTYVNAALAYTPYFAAKSDVFGYAVDDGRTDLAIERMNKGAFTLNPGEFFAGANEIYHSVAHHELPDPAREAMAEKRLLGHSSPSDLSRDEAKDAPVSEKINPAIRRARRAALFTERTQPRALMTPTAQPYAMAAMTAPRPNERFVDFLHRINEQPASEPHYSLAP
ncbi:MAG: hypothetical protein JO089_06935, partial [Alphaproteobacteria bacterium]|nr:hypothetical protein [Alphaproteobacteria bacterium]